MEEVVGYTSRKYALLGVGGLVQKPDFKKISICVKSALGNNRVALTAVVYLRRPFA